MKTYSKAGLILDKFKRKTKSKKMKTKILVTTFLLISKLLLAQEAAKEIKNDIGFNTNFILNGIFNSSSSNPFVFMYKHQLAERKALRLGMSFNVNLNSISGNPTNYNSQDFYSINPSVGKEWQSQLSKRWIWYYGTDIRASLSGNSFSNYGNNQQVSEQQQKYYGLSFAPFLGIRFVISEKLYVATEANISIGYNNQKTINKSFNNGVQFSSQENSSNGFSANTASAYGIFLFYRF